MPTSEQILAATTAIANDWISVAIAWHVVIAIALAAIALGWRPTHRAATLFIAMLPASVAVFALAYGNPFNGIVFVATTVALVALAVTDTRGRIGDVPRWTFAAGAVMVGFAWVYPHFLSGSSLQYLYAAPVGLVPCPSLSMAIGLSLLAGGAGRRAWRMTLAAVGLLYGVYGAARLGVVIDVALFAGAALLGATAFTRARRPTASQRDAWPPGRGPCSLPAS
jgi:hypothetical protein